MEIKKANPEYEITNLEKKVLVNLWLDDYDNIFSDFDPRPYSLRELSDDFLNETKKIINEITNENLEIVFLIPQSLKNKTTEHIIATRLHSYFKKKAHHQEAEQKKDRRNGIILSLIGGVLMIGATFSAQMENNQLFYNFLRILLEPAGWFMTWYGLDHIFYIAKEKNHELRFNKKMAKAEIVFDAYSNRE
ncbi:MAG: hypothetical protein WC843_05870 [Candidatus Gracilibacteria bacterium]